MTVHHYCASVYVCVCTNQSNSADCLLPRLSLNNPNALSVSDFDGLSYPLNWSQAPRGNILVHVNAFETVKIWVGIKE